MNGIESKGFSPVVSPDALGKEIKIRKESQNNKTERFDNVLRAQLQKASGVKFSAHAMDRIDQRKINMDSDEAVKVGNAVKTAREKGAKDSLFIGNGYALIVNIPNKTVITAMDSDQMDKAVVTNIDSTVMVK